MAHWSKAKSLSILGFIASMVFTHAEARSIAEIRKTGILTVGVSNNVPPFQVKAGDLSVGYEIEVIRAIANELGMAVKFKDIPSIPNLTKALANDEVDAIISTLAITSTREKGGDFTNAYACLGASIFTNESNVKTEHDLEGKTLGMVSDTAFLNYLKKQNVAKSIIEYPTAEIMMQNFVDGKHQGTIAWKAMIPYINKVYRLNLQDTPVLWSIPVGIMVHENNNGLRLALNTSIAKLQRNGTFDKLDKKYFPTDSVKCK